MENKPRFGVPVRDLEQSIAFYRDRVGLSLATDTGAPDTAVLTTSQNQRFLLAGPDAPDWGELLADPYTVLRKGEKIFMLDSAFEERLSRLSADGVAFQLIERPWGDRMIEIDDPDGYGVTFSMILERTREQILEMAQMARDGVRNAVEGLSNDELSWRPNPEAWSIREVVHHLADSNLTVLHVVRVALAEPGRKYQGNPYDQNHYAAELRYQERDIEPSLRLFEVVHDTLVSMIQVIPDAWERTVRTSGDGETSVETYMLMQATHALEHLEQIKGVRRALDRSH